MAKLEARLLPLDELQREISELEAGSFLSMDDDELTAKIKRIHEGLIVRAPSVDAGKIVFRAVKVAERPATKSKISYPPAGLVRTNGRVNRPGESIFYGAFNHFAACLYECNAQVGDIFAVSAWLTTERMVFNHLGYSPSALQALKTNRETPFFAIIEDDSDRNRAIREWQARVFTQVVQKGSESTYRLPIALKEYALGRIVQGTQPTSMQFSGLIYPSIAMWQLTDNVAILPSEVDSKMALIEVILLVLDHPSRESLDSSGGMQTHVHIRTYEFARPDKHGNLAWGQKSQFFRGNANFAIEEPLEQLPPE
ncbi:MAG: hypothetical protein ABSF28_18695 [Terracidiphilus sp.]